MKSNRRLILHCLILALSAARVAADTGSRADLIETATRFSPEYTRPVLQNDGSPLAIFGDLNGDALNDVAILTVLAERGVPTALDELRDVSRLYRNTPPNPLFVVETYFAGGEAVQSVELGRNPVLDMMELVRLSDTDQFPVAISVSTRSAMGMERTLVIYSPGGMIRHLQLQESEGQQHQMVDLDMNGTTDIVVTSRLPEAGRGYETFMEFLTLDGGGYRTRASFGLVRELRVFLQSAADLIAAGQWDDVRKMVDTGDSTSDDVEAEDILARVFAAVPDEEPEPFPENRYPAEPPAQQDQPPVTPTFNYPDTATPITAVVFPNIVENPFPYPYIGARFQLTFRVECCGGFPRLFSAVVRLSSNPFDQRPFAFLTQPQPQQ